MLIVATRERDAASAQIESLRRELSLYLSVPAVEGKKLGPRATTMTRVGRMPLVPVTQSEKVNNNNIVTSAPSSAQGLRVGNGSEDFEEHLPPLAEDEMTLDEIM